MIPIHIQDGLKSIPTGVIALRDKKVERATKQYYSTAPRSSAGGTQVPSIQPVFLENPIYSIVAYNKVKRPPSSRNLPG